MKHFFSLCLSLFIFPCFMFSNTLQTADLFSNHAVLQHGRELPVWGWAAPGARIEVSFAGQSVTAIVDASGAWGATLQALEISKEGQTMTVTSDQGATLKFNDVLVGDVWVASGQSNMGFPVNASLDSQRVFADPDNLIRYFAPPIEFQTYPLRRYSETVKWEPATGDLSWKSAVAYFFAESIRHEVDIPVGLYLAARGGTMIQPFMPTELHKYLPEASEDNNVRKLKQALEQRDPALAESKQAFVQSLDKMESWVAQVESSAEAGQPFNRMPTPPGQSDSGDSNLSGLYNSFFAPMEPFPVKGVIWYQGESNGGDRGTYVYYLDALIESMREMLNGDGDFPFYIVQLANYGPDEKIPGADDGNVGVREAQRVVAMSMKNTGLAVTHDIGNPTDIHPKNKVDVGRRLARWALNRDYGREDVMVSGPLFQRQEIKGDEIVLHFAYTGSGLMAGKKSELDPAVPVDGPPERFAIAGEDREFVWANARIEGDTVVVSSPEVPRPRYVRYAYSASPTGNLLYNCEGLPASPFKTDPW